MARSLFSTDTGEILYQRAEEKGQGAGGREQGAGSRGQGAGSREQGAGIAAGKLLI